eukprot:7148330-Pyramimonas_sp.AAC.1
MATSWDQTVSRCVQREPCFEKQSPQPCNRWERLRFSVLRFECPLASAADPGRRGCWWLA